MMFMSPLFSSKDNRFSPLSSAGFFFALTFHASRRRPIYRQLIFIFCYYFRSYRQLLLEANAAQSRLSAPVPGPCMLSRRAAPASRTHRVFMPGSRRRVRSAPNAVARLLV
jgi:hypothetical protein